MKNKMSVRGFSCAALAFVLGLAPFSVRADENSTILSSYKQQFCDKWRDASPCNKAESFAKLSGNLDDMCKNVGEDLSQSGYGVNPELRACEHNQEILRHEIKAFFAGAKSASCAAASGDSQPAGIGSGRVN